MQKQKFIEVGASYAMTAARFSKDPGTKVGASILKPNGALVSTGWNGFAPNVNDSEARLLDRDIKLQLTLHAEVNAILEAARSLKGCTIFTYPFPPCAPCASIIIRSEISHVIAIVPDPIPARWEKNFLLAEEALREAGVEFTKISSVGGTARLKNN